MRRNPGLAKVDSNLLAPAPLDGLHSRSEMIPMVAFPHSLPGLEEPYERLFRRLDHFSKNHDSARVYLCGPSSSGRRTLLKRLETDAAKELGLEINRFDLQPYGHDTPANILLRIAAEDPQSSDAEILITLSASWSDRVSAARNILKRSKADVFLVRFPPGALPAGERADRQIQQESLEAIQLLIEPRENKLHVIAVAPGTRLPGAAPASETIRLETRCNSDHILRDCDYWGNLAGQAEALADLLGKEADGLSPLQLRLGVALVAGQTSLAHVKESLHAGSTIRDLETSLRKMLDKHPDLGAAIARIARARTAVAAEVMESIANSGQQWELLSKCFLYPDADGRLLLHDQLRWLAPQSAAPESEAHEQLRGYYERLDGAKDPRTGLGEVIPWLEKLHHASLADANGEVDAWLALNPPTREHYWEYGWSLSYVHHRYEAAAKVFRALLDRDPQDNYAQHYYAYNLDRAGRSAVEVEKFYRSAVAGDPVNAWWNSRLISFLTGRGRFEAAIRAWNLALEAIDPGGDRSGEDWLTHHLHKHVIASGLESGNLELAGMALRSIREPASGDPHFRLLESQLKRLLEIRQLGESLFPASVEFQQWWQPRLLVPRSNEEFKDWRAGRVLLVSDGEVRLALGYRPSQAESAVIFYQVIPKADWKQASGEDEPVEGDYFEVATINGIPALKAEHLEPSQIDQGKLADLLRFLSIKP